MNLSQTIAWLREHQDVLVLTHARPDGDAWGSAVAFEELHHAVHAYPYVQN